MKLFAGLAGNLALLAGLAGWARCLAWTVSFLELLLELLLAKSEGGKGSGKETFNGGGIFFSIWGCPLYKIRPQDPGPRIQDPGH